MEIALGVLIGVVGTVMAVALVATRLRRGVLQPSSAGAREAPPEERVRLPVADSTNGRRGSSLEDPRASGSSSTMLPVLNARLTLACRGIVQTASHRGEVRGAGHAFDSHAVRIGEIDVLDGAAIDPQALHGAERFRPHVASGTPSDLV